MATCAGVAVTGDAVSADVVSSTPASANVGWVWLAAVDCTFVIVAAGSIVSGVDFVVAADAGAAAVASVVADVGAVVVVSGTEVVGSSVGLAVVDSGFPIMRNQH